MALVTAMAVGAAAEPQCSLVIEGEAEGAEVGQRLRVVLVARTVEIHHCPIRRN